MVDQPITINWGILATGNISRCFAKDLLVDPKTRGVHDILHKVVAVGSRSIEKAQNFIDTIVGGDKSVKAYGSYREVYDDKDVHAIYVGTPHTHHYENGLNAIKAGKHVLIEKPISCNAAELRSLLEAAKEQKVFVMEALWTRFQPLTLDVKKIVEEGSLGAPVVLHADLSGNFDIQNLSRNHRILDPNLGGGALLDLGPYPLVWAIVALYEHPLNKLKGPTTINGTMLKTPITGVDSNTSFILTFGSADLSAKAILSCSINVHPQQPGVNIRFENGTITIPAPIYCPKEFTVRYIDKSGEVTREERKVHEYVGGGWHFQADEVARCIRDGKKESEVWTHSKSLLEMEIFDQVRSLGSYIFPAGVEKPAPRSSCIFFTLGRCAKGDACSFAHSGPSESPKSHEPTGPGNLDGTAPQPVCRYWVNGNCRRGDECRFAHEHSGEKHEEDAFLSSHSSGDIPSHDPTPDTMSSILSTPDHEEVPSVALEEDPDQTELPAVEEQRSGDQVVSSSEANNLWPCTDGVPCNTHETSPETDHSCSTKSGTPIPREAEHLTLICPEEAFAEPEGEEPKAGSIDSPHDEERPLNNDDHVIVRDTSRHQEDMDRQDVEEEAATGGENWSSRSAGEPDMSDAPLPVEGSFLNLDAIDSHTEIVCAGGNYDNSETHCTDAHVMPPDGHPHYSYDTQGYPAQDQETSAAGPAVLHWSEYADPYADLTIPFCKFLTQARCAQRAACRFRHSLSINEYALLFRDPQPLLWTPSAPLRHEQGAQRSTVSSFGVCKFYPLGKCRNGDACPYLHAPSTQLLPVISLEQVEDQDDEPEYSFGSQDEHRTQPCRYYLEFGNCRRGDQCYYSHDNAIGPQWNGNADGEGATDDERRDNQSQAVRTGYTQRRLCRRFQEGYCQWDDRCKYLHDSWSAEKTGRVEVDASAENPATMPEENGWRADAEGWGSYADGWAREGDDNPPADDTQPASQGWPPEEEDDPWAPKLAPCPYHARGRCKKGNDCGFRHETPKGTYLRNARGSASRSPTPTRTPVPSEHLDGLEDHSHEPAVDLGWDASVPDETSRGTNDAETRRAPAADGRLNHESENEFTPWANEDEKSWALHWSDEVVQPLVPAKFQSPCKAFGQGYCAYGDSCRYQHIVEVDVFPEERKRSPAPVESPDGEALSDTMETLGMEDLPTDEVAAPEQQPEEVVERELFNCTVRFGLDDACSPMNIATASDSCCVVVSNLPPDISYAEAVELAGTIDDVEHGFEDLACGVSDSGAEIIITFASPRDAVKAVVKLHGQTYDSRPLTARLATESITSSWECSTVKITWPSPSRSAWAYYPTITAAKTHEKRLDGLTFQGRKIKASFSRPRANDTTFAVKLSGLLVDTENTAIEQLSQASLVHMNASTYVGCPLDSIRDALAARGSLERFYRLHLDPARPKHMAFARFDSGLSNVMAAHGIPQPFLGDLSLSLQKVFYANYRISARRHQAVRLVLERLCSACQDRCVIRICDGAEPVEIHIYADAVQCEAFGSTNRKLQAALLGEVMVTDDGVAVWDEYFDLSSSARAVEKVNAQTSFLVKLDHRTQRIRVIGDDDSRFRARGAMLKLLKMVRAQRSVIPLDLPTLRVLVDGAYTRLQTELGANKVTLDVTVPQLIVRGDADARKAKASLAATASSTSGDAHADRRTGSGASSLCALCYRPPRSPTKLSCRHVYCKTCLQYILQVSAGLQLVPPRCIAQRDGAGDESIREGGDGQCGVYVPYVMVRDLLRTVEEAALLRNAFLAYVRARPDEFFFCPTPHCETVYRPKAQERLGAPVYTCPTCSTQVCSVCRLEYHEGLDCMRQEGSVVTD
ncbi:putative oxidoreductase family, NAD-binding Rossmann fold [Lyophyllum shimeji]|uniref:D-xylose 1-dehydrogenase (NADP(+), D-xylono-1,5-lactone-forming) n=1 Tax=Lyophyllum shimeji TaxID=47721 RepID=A0A9P3UT26_LYOSH|nr:putative oxidoreductase family, NAD-binding Rossmann fold [Lyophyllum shimeji]